MTGQEILALRRLADLWRHIALSFRENHPAATVLRQCAGDLEGMLLRLNQTEEP